MSIRSGKATGSSSNIRKASTTSTNKPSTKTASQKKKNTKKGGILSVILGVIIGLVLISSVISIVTCPSTKQCRQIIAQFQTACNNEDPTGIVNCLKPSMKNNLIKIGTIAAGDMAMDGIMGLIGSGLETITGQENIEVDQIFKTITIEPKKFGFPGKTRKVTCRASFLGLTHMITIYVTKYEGDPYITKVRF